MKLKRDFLYFWENKLYLFSVLLISVISYGYAATNAAIGVDALEGSRYLAIWPTEGRIPEILSHAFWGIVPYHPFYSMAENVVGVVLLVIAGTVICMLFRKASNDRFSMRAYTAFSCAALSYPLINEIWVYNNAPIGIGVSMLSVAFSLLIIYDEIGKQKKSFSSLFAASILAFMIDDSYYPVYIFFVFAILILQYLDNRHEDRILYFIRQGLWYAGVLTVGLLIKVAVTKAYLLAFQTDVIQIGDTSISWGNGKTLAYRLRYLFAEIIDKLVLFAVLYYPILIFDIAALFLMVLGVIYAVKNKSWIILFLGAGLLLSAISLPIVQGRVIGYRVLSALAYLVGFSLMLFIDAAERSKSPTVIRGCIVLSMFICFSQAAYLNSLLTADIMRSKEEEFVIRSVGKDLHSSFDMEKPIVFTGNYTLSEDLEAVKYVDRSSVRYRIYDKLNSSIFDYKDTPERVYFLETNVRSVINWGLDAFLVQDGFQGSMQKVFSFYGVDEYIPADYNAIKDEVEAYLAEHQLPGYPRQGYITDVGDYIIVNFS